MRTLGILIAMVLAMAAANVASAADDESAVGDRGLAWRYTNLMPDGREQLLLEEQSAAASERSRQRQSFSHQELLTIVSEAALRNGLEPELLCALAFIESTFRPYAVSPMGAQGLMQLMPTTARRYGVRDLFNPVESAEGGARYLSTLLERYDNDLELALAAYNAGEGAVRPGRPLPPNAPTIGFVQAVLQMRDNYRNR